jgi:hypothetical protein
MLVLTFKTGREWENGKMIETFWWRRAQDWNRATCLFTLFSVSVCRFSYRHCCWGLLPK